MRRREFLGVVGAGASVFVAGCKFGDDTTQTPESTPSPTPAATTTPTAMTTDQTQAETTPNPSGGQAEVEITDSQFIEDGLVQISVVNNGDVPSGAISIVVQWFDGRGYFLGTDSTALPTLAAGQPWLAWVRPTIYHRNDVADFAVIGDFNPTPPQRKQGMALAGSSLRSDHEYITGTVSNSNSQRTSARLVGKLLDSSGWVIGWGQRSKNDIPPDTDWRFAIPVGGVHTELSTQPVDHNVLVLS